MKMPTSLVAAASQGSQESYATIWFLVISNYLNAVRLEFYVML
jgi:hypothetical protein